MKVTDILNKFRKGENLVSFEVLPPLKGKSINSLYRILDPLMEFKPPFIDVTYHREDFEYRMTPSGYFEKISVRKRPGTVGICSAIMHKYDVVTVPHLICGGFTKEETENALIDLSFLGVRNILALRGDPRRSEKIFVPENGGHKYAVELIRQIDSMNQGLYLDQDIHDAIQTDFCIGAAGYPEKHFEAANSEEDLLYLKEKVEMGAQYIVTQMFFDNRVFFRFVEDCRAIGIDVPIIPGIKPLTRMAQLKSIPSYFYINFPSDLVKAAHRCKNDEEVRQLGIEWSIAQAKELFKNGVSCIHIYTMSNQKTVAEICSALL